MVLPMILKRVILMQILHCNVKKRRRLPAFPQGAFFSVAGAGADAAKNKFARPQLEQKDSQCLYFIISHIQSPINATFSVFSRQARCQCSIVTKAVFFYSLGQGLQCS